MPGSRSERIADQIRELVSQVLTFETRDPGIGLLTITHVKITADLQLAQIYYTMTGDAAERRATARALERATPYVRRRVAEDLNLRRAPEVRFHFDEHVERQERVELLLKEIAAEREARATSTAPEPEEEK
jgi:ribosome-binding factor A